MNLKQRISTCYKVPRMTAFIEEDLKLIKRINLLICKLEKNPEKEIYILETINLMRTLLNVMSFNSLYLLLCEFLEMKYHELLSYILEEVDNLTSHNSTIIKKFQELSEDEES